MTGNQAEKLIFDALVMAICDLCSDEKPCHRHAGNSLTSVALASVRRNLGKQKFDEFAPIIYDALINLP